MPLNLVGYRLEDQEENPHLALLGVGLGDKDIIGIQNGTIYIFDDCWSRFKFGDQDVILVVARVEGEQDYKEFKAYLREAFPPGDACREVIVDNLRRLARNYEDGECFRMPPRSVCRPDDNWQGPEGVLTKILTHTPRPLRSLVTIAQWDDWSITVHWSKMKISALIQAFIRFGEAIKAELGEKG